MMGLLYGLLAGLVAVLVMLAVKFGGASKQSAVARSSQAQGASPSSVSVTASGARKKSWPWIAVLAVAGIAALVYFHEGSPGEVHSVRVVMSNLNGLRIEVPRPGKYVVWVDNTDRLQCVDRDAWGNCRMIPVRPDGFTPDISGGYYNRTAYQNFNPIPGAPTFAMIFVGRGQKKAVPKGGGAIEIKAVDAFVVDINLPKEYVGSFVDNKGENTIHYQRRG